MLAVPWNDLTENLPRSGVRNDPRTPDMARSLPSEPIHPQVPDLLSDPVLSA